MKIKIKYKEKYLDLFSSTAIQLELNNPIYYDATGELSGAYSFPFDIPASNLNRLLFNFLDLAQSKASFQSSEKAMIEFEGISLFEGTLVCINASKDKFKIKIVVSPLYDFKNVKLNELDMGSFDLGTSLFARRQHLEDSVITPALYDFSCFPVFNNGYDGLKDPTPGPGWEDLFQNPFFFPSQTFSLVRTTPFIRLSVALNSIFKGFLFRNYFQQELELESLYLYNNYNIRQDENSVTPDQIITYSNHVSDILVSDFIKGLQLQFCLGLFKHFSKNEVKLIAIKDILKSTPTENWTNKILKDSNLEPITSKIGIFAFEKSGLDSLEHDYVEQEIDNTVGKREDIIDLSKAVWVQNLALIYKNNELIRTESKKVLSQKDSTLSVKLGRLEMIHWFRKLSTGKYDVPPIPHVACFVAGSRFDLEGKPKCPNKLFFYRGMVNTENSQYPLASNNNYDQNGIDTYNYSLNWDGEKGLYNTFHKEWHRITADGKLLSCQINLTTTELYNVDMSEVIHISGSNYVIKNLKVNLTSEGLKPVSAQLVKII